MAQGVGPFKFVYEGLTGPGAFASQTIRDKAHSENSCSNCLNYKSKKYPRHTAQACPFTMPDCVPRSSNHTPVPPTDGNRFRNESPHDRLQQFLDERSTSFQQGGTQPVRPSLLATPTTSLPRDPIPSKAASLHPIQLQEVHEASDDDDITIPNEPPAKGPIRVTAWAASASPQHRTVSHLRCTLPPSPWPPPPAKLGVDWRNHVPIHDSG